MRDFFAASAQEYVSMVEKASRLIDIQVDAPTWPFTETGGVWDVADHALIAGFEPVLTTLAELHNDETVWVAMVKPTSSIELFERDGEYPAFALPSASIAQSYERCLLSDVKGTPCEIYDVADRLVIGGSSGQWAVWADREYEMAILYARNGPVVWRDVGIGFQNTMDEVIGLAELTRWVEPLDHTVRNALISSFRAGGTPAWEIDRA